MMCLFNHALHTYEVVNAHHYIAMATGEAGYDYYYVQPPPEGLLCKICKLPCREAQVSEDLVYCKHCVPDNCVAGVKASVSVSRSRYATK